MHKVAVIAASRRKGKQDMDQVMNFISNLNDNVVWGVGRAAAQKGVSVIAFAGTVKADADELEKMGISAAFSIANGPIETGECIRDAAKLLNNAASMVFRTAALAEVR